MPGWRHVLFLAAGVALRAASVEVSEVVAQGQPSYQIRTPAATWVYHREGAGFCALLDPAGHDWISYRPAGGAAGHFRGIPNAVFRRGQEGGNFFHPGHAGVRGSDTTLVAADAGRAVLRSVSRDGRWTADWEILPDRAVLRLRGTPAPDARYWFLYEGTPGGVFDRDDLCVRPGGRVSSLADSWEATTRDTPWVAFVSRRRGHALILAARRVAEAPVSYRPMEDAMTVFGFGRALKNVAGQLEGEGVFAVALVAETDPAKVAARAAALAGP